MKFTGPIEELQKKFSHREFRTRIAWMDLQYNHPSRADYYMMRLIGTVEHLLDRKYWELKDYRIPFKIGPVTEAELRAKAQQQKELWKYRLRRGQDRRQTYGRRSGD